MLLTDVSQKIRNHLLQPIHRKLQQFLSLRKIFEYLLDELDKSSPYHVDLKTLINYIFYS